MQIIKGPLDTLHENLEFDIHSAQTAIPDSTAFRVFRGDELHPDVDNFIRSTAGTNCSDEVFFVLLNLYLSYFCLIASSKLFVYVIFA